MKISEKKKTELYAAIDEAIMKKRIKIAVEANIGDMVKASHVDGYLFKLNQDIWLEVKRVLNINE